MKRGIAFLIVALCAGAEVAHADVINTVDDNWNKHCKKCHGVDGEATKIGLKLKAPPDLFSAVGAKSRDVITDYIENGKNKMPKYRKKLSTEEIAALVEFVEYASLTKRMRENEDRIDSTLEQIKKDYKNLPECDSVTQ